MQSILLGHHKIKYRVVGESGPLLILIHGFGGGPGDWQPLLPFFKNNYRCVILNYRSFFASPVVVGFEEQVAKVNVAIYKILSSFQEDSFYLIGASYGGTIATAVEKFFMEKVKKMVLLNPMPFAPSRYLRSSIVKKLFSLSKYPWLVALYFRTSWGQQVMRDLAQIFHVQTNNDRLLRPRFFKLITTAFFKFSQTVSYQLWCEWREPLFTPNNTLLVYGTQDPLFTAYRYEKLGEELGVEVHPYSEGDHFLMKADVSYIAKMIKGHFEHGLLEEETLNVA